MVEATGKSHEEWFAILDAWGGTDHDHTEIARHVIDELGVPGWWGQSITVSYERARGLRAVGQMKDGWTINASRTINAAVGELFDAFEDLDVRRRWLPDAELSTRTATRPKSARYDWEDGSTRVVVAFEAKGSQRGDRLRQPRAPSRRRHGRGDEGLLAIGPGRAQGAPRVAGPSPSRTPRPGSGSPT